MQLQVEIAKATPNPGPNPRPRPRPDPGSERNPNPNLTLPPTLSQAELAEAERSLLDGAIGLLDGGLSGRADSARSMAANPYMIETPARLARQLLREQWEMSHAKLHYHLLLLEETKMQQACARRGMRTACARHVHGMCTACARHACAACACACCMCMCEAQCAAGLRKARRVLLQAHGAQAAAPPSLGHRRRPAGGAASRGHNLRPRGAPAARDGGGHRAATA